MFRTPGQSGADCSNMPNVRIYSANRKRRDLSFLKLRIANFFLYLGKIFSRRETAPWTCTLLRSVDWASTPAKHSTSNQWTPLDRVNLLEN